MSILAPKTGEITGITIQLYWAEAAPGWNATAWPTAHYLDDTWRWTSGTTISATSPLPAIRDAIEGIARRLNIHPDNTVVTILADGDELLEAHRRSTR